MFESSWFWWLVFGIASVFILFGGKILSLRREKEWRSTSSSQYGEQKVVPPPPPKKVVEEENHAGRNTTLTVMFLLASLFLVFSGIKPTQTMIPLAPEGMVYIPFYGLLLAGSWGAFVSTLWSLYDEVDDSALFFPIALVLLIFGIWFGVSHGLLAPIHVDQNIDFTPFINDLMVGWGWAAGGTFLAYYIVSVISNRDQTKVIALIILVALWLPQFSAFIHAVF